MESSKIFSTMRQCMTDWLIIGRGREVPFRQICENKRSFKMAAHLAFTSLSSKPCDARLLVVRDDRTNSEGHIIFHDRGLT